jgi:pseudouridine synthase
MLLYRYLLKAQIASRRKCSACIKEGHIKVNGKVLRDPRVDIDEVNDTVLLNNKAIKLEEKEQIYIALNKPAGYICSLKDRHAKKKVVDLIDIKDRIYPVGRLDKNTKGLLLLTNDGELAHRVMHPRFKIDKVYEVFIKPYLKKDDIRRIEKEVTLEEGQKVNAKVNTYNHDSENKGTVLKITIHQGLKRQIRRMFAALGYRVFDLIRLKVSNIELGQLRPGQYRNLNKNEVIDLKKMVGLHD